MNKQIKKVFIFVLCLVFPCLSLLTACSKKPDVTETGFVVFYDNEDITNLTSPLSIVKEADYDINGHLEVFAKYSDGTKKKLSVKSQNTSGYEISHNIPALSEIVYGTEYFVKVVYGDYTKYEVKITFCKRLLESPAITVDDEAEMLSWSAVQHATAYLYKVKKNDEVDFGEEIETTETSISLTWGWTVQVQAITTDVEFGSSGWTVMQSAWKPERETVDVIQVKNSGLTFELDDDGNPVIYKPELEYDENKIELVFDDGAVNFVNDGASDANVYAIRYRLKNRNKYCWSDGFTDERSTTWTIQEKMIETPTVTSVTKNGDGDYTLTGENIESKYFEHTVVETESGYKVTFSLKYKNSTYWTDSEQYWLSGEDDIELTIPFSTTAE